jgi:origin recognition complex subunit 3
MKHFSSDLLTVLVHSTPSVGALSHPNSSRFLEAVSVRIQEDEDVNMDDRSPCRRVIDRVDNVRAEFYSRHRNLRVGFAVMRRMQTFLRSNHHKGLDWSADLESGSGLCEAMLDVLRGNLMRDVKHLGMITKYVPDNDYYSISSTKAFQEIETR